MGDREFFQELLELFKQTTGASDSYWLPLVDEARMVAVGDVGREWVAAGVSEADLKWIAVTHAALPDIVRRLNHALDEADRLDVALDEAQARIAQLELEARSENQ